jgi:hypothetical protein
MKNSPRPLFLLHQTLHLAQYLRLGSGLLATAKPRFGRLVISHSREHVSTVQWWWALYHSSWRLALRMVILGSCADAWTWKSISGSSQQKVIVLTLLPAAIRNSVVGEDRGFLRVSALDGPILRLCGLTLHGWAIVAPRHFHFTITALTGNTFD